MPHKRVINGKSYNTATSALVHEMSWLDETVYEGLYQTKHGAFFIYSYNEATETGGIKPISDEDAQKWLEKYEVSAEIIERYFGNFPEGGAAETRITLRMPGNLYNRISAAAIAEKTSVNTYLMRQLERLH